MLLCLGTTPAIQRVMVFDQYVPGEVNRAAEVLECPSGKSINVARVAHALGAAVMAMGFAGGCGGQEIRRGLAAMGIAHDFVEVDQPTRTCITLIDRSRQQATELVEEPSPVAPANLAELRTRFSAAIPRARILCLSGTLAPGIPDDFLAGCVREASALGIPAIVDATGNPLRLALAARPFLVKPNRSELARTVGHPVDSPADLRRAIGQLINEGARWVLVSDGAGKVAVAGDNGFWTIDIPVVRPVNPIGSGDALAGGLAAALLRGESLPHAATAGIAAAISNTLHLLPGQIDLNQVALLRPPLAG